MKNLYLNLSMGAISALIIYIIFLTYQNNFNISFSNSLHNLEIDSSQLTTIELSTKSIENLVDKVENIKLYVTESQKNLDLWLKLLTFIFSLLIGYSIFSGLKTRELAKEELSEIRRIKDEIKRQANDAEDRIKDIKDQIVQIENTAASAKSIEVKMSERLIDIGTKSELVLSSAHKILIEEAIVKAQEDLRNGGLEAFKNLYYAKALKAKGEKRHDDAVRLLTVYLDLDDKNFDAFFQRGFAFAELAMNDKNKNILLDKALLDYNEAFRLMPDNTRILNNIGTVYERKGEHQSALITFEKGIELSLSKMRELNGEELIKERETLAQIYFNKGSSYGNLDDINSAIINYTKSIELRPTYALAYLNRSKAYKGLGKENEAAEDLAKAIKHNPEIINS